MVQKFPGKVSRDSESCWISEMRTIQPNMLEIPGAKLIFEWKENFREEVSEKFGYTSRGNFGKCCSIRYWKLPKIQTGSFGWMESALEISSDLIMI